MASNRNYASINACCLRRWSLEAHSWRIPGAHWKSTCSKERHFLSLKLDNHFIVGGAWSDSECTRQLQTTKSDLIEKNMTSSHNSYLLGRSQYTFHHSENHVIDHFCILHTSIFLVILWIPLVVFSQTRSRQEYDRRNWGGVNALPCMWIRLEYYKLDMIKPQSIYIIKRKLVLEEGRLINRHCVA